MSLGYLASVSPDARVSTQLYESPSLQLVEGKIVVLNKDSTPSRIRIGISSGSEKTYLEYNRIVNYGETFETGTIYFGNQQRVFVYSDNDNSNFLLYGETLGDETNPQRSGLLSNLVSTNSTKKKLYQSRDDLTSLVSLSLTNLGSEPAKARIGISTSGLNNFNTEGYIEYDVEIYPGQTYNRNNLILNYNQSIICSSSENSIVDFSCYGKLFTESTVADENLIVTGNARIDGNLGIGTLLPRGKLDVNGNSLISGNLSVSGILAAQLSTVSVNDALVGLGTLPSMDGSALTGIIATGTGVQVNSNGSPVGTAATLDFGGGNLVVDFTEGQALIRTSENINIPGNLTVGLNRFKVTASSGNIETPGSMIVGAGISVTSGNINTLNNRVKNVGLATESGDATNKAYTDTRSIVMAIALS